MNKNQKYIATQAIFEALTGGRKLSQMDCREFEVEDMRTPISHMKDRIDNAGFNLRTQWIQTPKGRRRWIHAESWKNLTLVTIILGGSYDKDNLNKETSYSYQPNFNFR